MNEATNEGRATAGAEHLQTAALEMISAMRAFLDVAEDVVTSSDRVDDLTRIFGSVAQGVSNATGFPVPGARPSSPTPSDSSSSDPTSSESSPSESSPSDDSADPDVDLRPSGVQHIRVS